VAAVTAHTSADTPAAPYLPKPTGTQPVGTTSLYLKDTSRPDPWVAEANARQLMVSLWYPAKSTGKRRAQYMTPMESELLLKGRRHHQRPVRHVQQDQNQRVHRQPTGRPETFPAADRTSPGFINPRSVLTALAEDLASHGYVVAGIEHTYESVATMFPDGRVTTCLACEVPDRTDTFWKKVDQGRAADVSFVLDELTRPHSKWNGASLIDPSRTAMAGHSAGGASTLAAMATDSRLRAGIDIDGLTNDPIPDTVLSRPFLFLGRQSNFSPGMPSALSWEREWRRLTGWKHWLVVTGAVHASFTAVAILAEQINLDTGADLPATRSTEITRAYTRAFFDRHLRGKPQPSLGGPSTRYPEVTFCAAETHTCA
jgi:hypothetical protein